MHWLLTVIIFLYQNGTSYFVLRALVSTNVARIRLALYFVVRTWVVFDSIQDSHYTFCLRDIIIIRLKNPTHQTTLLFLFFFLNKNHSVNTGLIRDLRLALRIHGIYNNMLFNIRYGSTSNWNNNNVHTRRRSSHTIARIKKSNFTTAEQHLKTQLPKHNTIIMYLNVFLYKSQFIFLKMKPT